MVGATLGASDMPARPLVSVIIATYMRTDVLRWALRSVMDQTLTDWELLVVGDACGAATEKAVREATGDDPRVKYVNLARNCGEQSGPNNVGVARSSGRYIAFLNQDDVWFPDHLQVLLDWLECRGADLVFAHSAHISTITDQVLRDGDWHAVIEKKGKGEDYDPAVTLAPASAWLMRRPCAEVVGTWRAAAECVVYPSQDFLFRAWRKGLRLKLCPEVTVVMFGSTNRPGAYIDSDAMGQAWCHAQMSDPSAFRARILARAHHTPHPVEPARHGWRARLGNLMDRCLMHVGIHPRSVRYRLQLGARRGALLNGLRRVRGLPDLTLANDLDALRVRAVHGACFCQPGVPVDFSLRGTGECHQLDGWAHPEAWGTWTVGPRARLMLRLLTPFVGESVLRIRARPYLDRQCASQRVEVMVQGRPTVSFRLTDAALTKLDIPIGPQTMGDAGAVEIVLLLPDCRSPAHAGLSGDVRALGIGVVDMQVQGVLPTQANT